MASSGDPTLVLVPTALELERLADLGGFGPVLVAVCGFGPIAAAARTASLISELRPARALLVGIAGAFDVRRDPVGSALEFASVAVDGIGAGAGREFLTPSALGFPQWPGALPGAAPIFETLAIAAPAGVDALLLTTCAASASRAQADERRERHPAARAEDMEGFAVAAACAIAGTPLRIVRGISNEVGDRDPAHWSIPRALAGARRAALAVLDQPWPARGRR
jgi:futalosine hydrolase